MTPVVLGRISGVFGVKGWVRVYSHTEPREAILDYKNWLLNRDGKWLSVRVEDGKPHGRAVIAKLKDTDDRDAAAALLNVDIAVSRDDMPQTKADEYYWADLEGLKVVDRDGRRLGKVSYLMATGANDVLVVDGDRENLIPFVMGDVILDVDLDAGVIHVDWEWD
jgi:16S rRNA processing protein RimM